jgi:hypothetical protein
MEGTHPKSMPGGDCILRQEFIPRPGVVQGCCCISNVAGQSPLPESVHGSFMFLVGAGNRGCHDEALCG